MKHLTLWTISSFLKHFTSLDSEIPLFAWNSPFIPLCLLCVFLLLCLNLKCWCPMGVYPGPFARLSSISLTSTTTCFPGPYHFWLIVQSHGQVYSSYSFGSIWKVLMIIIKSKSASHLNDLSKTPQEPQTQQVQNCTHHLSPKSTLVSSSPYFNEATHIQPIIASLSCSTFLISYTPRLQWTSNNSLFSSLFSGHSSHLIYALKWKNVAWFSGCTVNWAESEGTGELSRPCSWDVRLLPFPEARHG